MKIMAMLMKNVSKLLIFLSGFLISFNVNAQVGIGTDNPDPSSVLDVFSNEKGMLIPRLTNEQRDAIENPAAGLMIFNTTSGCFNYYFNNEWLPLCAGTGMLPLPTLTTNNVTNITSNSATFGGNIDNSNGVQIAQRGIVYSTSPGPTLNSKKIIIGDGGGQFDTIIPIFHNYAHLLKTNTTYYVRAYAITENNIWAYGNQVTFTTLPVGQTGPGGGLVFFDKGNDNLGWQYLEVAESDQSPGVIWGCYGVSIPGTLNTLGSGELNTEIIVNGCNEENIAAKLCYNLEIGGQDDWFLPSRDELSLLRWNLHLNNQGNFNTSTSYWTSRQDNGANNGQTHADVFNFNNTFIGSSPKNSSLRVRAIRAY